MSGAPEIVNSIVDLRARLAPSRERHVRIGLVPTMGALHEGHLSLVRETRKRCGATVVSIFVNALQFGPNEDFARYPRTFEADLARCEAAGVELLYAPRPEQVCPRGFQTQVAGEQLTRRWDGSFRPGHFQGVTTVVTKLLNAVGPCLAVF